MDIKPMLLVEDDLSEGIYASSGSSASEGATYSLSLESSWENNKNYKISFTNNSSKKVGSVTVTLKVNGVVNAIDGNVSGTVNGPTATVTFNNYNQGFEPNETVSNVHMHVSGVGEFSLA